MSTHSAIGVLATEKAGTRTLKATYCHWNGSVDWNGVMLRRYYNTEAMAQSLIELGELSVIRERLAPLPNEQHTFDAPIRGKKDASGNWVSGAINDIRAGKSVEDAFESAPEFPFKSMGITVAYHRDREEPYRRPVEIKVSGENAIDDALRRMLAMMECRFGYLYDCASQKWWACCGKAPESIPLDNAIHALAIDGKKCIWY